MCASGVSYHRVILVFNWMLPWDVHKSIGQVMCKVWYMVCIFVMRIFKQLWYNGISVNLGLTRCKNMIRSEKSDKLNFSTRHEWTIDLSNFYVLYGWTPKLQQGSVCLLQIFTHNNLYRHNRKMLSCSIKRCSLIKYYFY